jgi:flagellar biosynthesis GTPase FlhF
MAEVHGSRTYRGSSAEELLPRIKAELGEDAVVISQREELVGGVGGFFRKRIVEIEAMPGDAGGRIDVYEGPDLDAFATELAAAEARPPELETTPAPGPRPAVEPAGEVEAPPSGAAGEPTRKPGDDEPPGPPTARAGPPGEAEEDEPDVDFELAVAGMFGPPPARGALTPPGGAPAAESPAAPPSAPHPASRPAEADVVEYSLATRGLSPEFARELVAEAVTHGLAFLPRQRLARAVRETLARRLPVLPPRPEAGISLAVVGAPGAGKTSTVARLASAYAGHSDLPVLVLALHPLDGADALRTALAPRGVVPEVVDSGAAARSAIESADPAIVLIDTPPVDPERSVEVDALRADLREAEVDEVHLALAATLSVPAAAEAADGLAPLAPIGVVLTRVDESEFVGGLLELAIRRRLPVSYVLGSQTFAAGDPRRLAGLVLP